MKLFSWVAACVLVLVAGCLQTTRKHPTTGEALSLHGSCDEGSEVGCLRQAALYQAALMDRWYWLLDDEDWSNREMREVWSAAAGVTDERLDEYRATFGDEVYAELLTGRNAAAYELTERGAEERTIHLAAAEERRVADERRRAREEAREDAESGARTRALLSGAVSVARAARDLSSDERGDAGGATAGGTPGGGGSFGADSGGEGSGPTAEERATTCGRRCPQEVPSPNTEDHGEYLCAQATLLACFIRCCENAGHSCAAQYRAQKSQVCDSGTQTPGFSCGAC